VIIDGVVLGKSNILGHQPRAAETVRPLMATSSNCKVFDIKGRDLFISVNTLVAGINVVGKFGFVKLLVICVNVYSTNASTSREVSKEC
jgi:hypothetical protein